MEKDELEEIGGYTYEVYYQKVIDALIGMDETRHPDAGAVRLDWEGGIDPEESAREFYDTWNL